MNLEDLVSRYFISYSGVKLPLKLVNEIDEGGLDNRNTFFKGYYDERNRLVRCEKLVYGETELLHSYEYDENDVLRQAEITDADGELTLLTFDEQGQPI